MKNAEVRWLLIVQDGYHTTLGRHRDPEPEDLVLVASQLDAQQLAGWLAVSKGDYWDGEREPEVMMVRRLSEADGDWDAALTMWRGARRKAISES